MKKTSAPEVQTMSYGTQGKAPAFVHTPSSIQRVKDYRQKHGCSLMEAKAAIEREILGGPTYAELEFASWNPISVIDSRANRDHTIGLLVNVARKAWYAMDDSCYDHTLNKTITIITMAEDSFEELEEALNALDELPENMVPNLIMEGPSKAEFILLGHANRPTQA